MGPLTRVYRNIARYAAHHGKSDLGLAMQLAARDSSARFIIRNMLTASRLADREAMLQDAIRRVAALDGCICEFGVYQGYTLRLLAQAAPERRVYGFDSFEGLPEQWREGFDAGAFSTEIPRFEEPNVELVPGWFENSLPTFLQRVDTPIALLHVDCDLYSSTRTVLQYLAPRLAAGAVVVFDEYLNYPGWQQHEHRALREAQAAGFRFEYSAYTEAGEQLMITVASPSSDPHAGNRG